MTEEETECEQLHNSVQTQYTGRAQHTGSWKYACKMQENKNKDTCRQVERTTGLMGMMTDDRETWLNCFSVEIRNACCFFRGLKREASTDL